MERSDMHNRIARLNQPWWSNGPNDEKTQMENFTKAMNICEEEFLEELKNQFANIFISKAIVKEAWD